MKKIMGTIFTGLITSAVASDIAYYHPSIVNLLEDTNHLKVEYETKYFPRYFAGNEVRKSNLIVDDTLNIYYVSPKMLGGKFTLVHKKDFTTTLNSAWSGPISAQSAYNFELTTTLTQIGYAKKIDDLSLFAGINRVYKRGRTIAYPATFSIENDADGVDYGGILSLTYNIKEWLFVTLNYTSRVDVKLEGSNITNLAGKTTATTTLEHPATANANIFMYTSKDALWTASIEKKFWSAHSRLDIDYGNPIVEGAFGAPIAKNWKDIMIYKFGHKHTFNNLSLLGMIAYAEDMVPDSTRDYALPGGDITAFIIRADYKIYEDFTLNLGYKHLSYEESVYSNSFNTEFSNNGANVYTVGTEYKF